MFESFKANPKKNVPVKLLRRVCVTTLRTKK